MRRYTIVKSEDKYNIKKIGDKYVYNVKTIESKSTKEIWIYSHDIFLGFKPPRASSGTKRKLEDLSFEEQALRTARREKYYKNRRWDISRLINTNYDEQTKFLTLTFEENIEDVTTANSIFNKFIKRLKYQLRLKQNFIELKYIATWEKQKRGAIHYHLVLFGFPYVRKQFLQEIWGHGFIKINEIKNLATNTVGQYISKYFAKDLSAKETGKKAFFKSRNLIAPIEKKLSIPNITNYIYDLQNEPITYQKRYNNNFRETGDYVIYYQIDQSKKVEPSSETLLCPTSHKDSIAQRPV